MSSPGRRTVLSLYRQLMRLHQKLPPDMGAVGQMFIREEFKKHRSASDDIAEKFVKEWREYACSLESQLGGSSGPDGVMGKTLSSKERELLSDEQLLQLGELYKETTKPQSTK